MGSVPLSKRGGDRGCASHKNRGGDVEGASRKKRAGGGGQGASYEKDEEMGGASRKKEEMEGCIVQLVFLRASPYLL